MIYLWLVSGIWAFSFGLIKKYLGNLDPLFVSGFRLTASLLVFLPLWKPKKATRQLAVQLFFIGAVQYGFMYIVYITSFRYLLAAQVAVLTIFTPIYVSLIADLWERRFQASHLIRAFLAMSGAAFILYPEKTGPFPWRGFFLMQISNLCFAFGQIAYRKCMKLESRAKERELFAFSYAGAFAAVAVTWFFSKAGIPPTISFPQILVLLYLGIIASALGFFWWNRGVLHSDPGRAAAMNNMKIPLSVLVSIVIFQESVHLFPLIAGGLLLFASQFTPGSKTGPVIPECDTCGSSN